MIEHTRAGDPHLSPDGQWWWNGREWVPAADSSYFEAGAASRHPSLAVPGDQPVLITIGNIACTQTTVITPFGTYPLAGTTWTMSNNTITTSSVSTIGVVLCILFFWTLIGLLFLLMKDTRTTGYVQVSVQGEGLYHAVQIPVSFPLAVAQIEHQVNYVRSLVAALPPTRTQ